MSQHVALVVHIPPLGDQCPNFQETKPQITNTKQKHRKVIFKGILYKCRKILFAPIKLCKRLKQMMLINWFST